MRHPAANRPREPQRNSPRRAGLAPAARYTELTMAAISDITNDFIRQEIEEFIERPDERERTVNLFARSRPKMQEIAAALIDGDNELVDRLTRESLDEGIEALEVMDY